jgi:hypothetical protein
MQSAESASFPASYDKTTKVISAVVCLFLLILALWTKVIWIGLIGTALVLLSYAWSPRSYSIENRSIAIHRLIGTARIPLDNVRELRPAMADDFYGCIRLFGNGGLFGYYGVFRTSKLGVSRWYMTNRDNAVVLITDTKTAMVSPDDVTRFIATVQASVPVPPTPTSATIPIANSRSSFSRFVVPAAGLGITLVVIGVISLAVRYSPGPPKYTLTSEALTIHDRFYPVTLKPGAVDLDHTRVIDLAVDKDWRPTLRTNGFANAHYRSGWYRLANGQTVRMYRADSRRLVLLPPLGNGVAVLLEVADPERFIGDLRRAWQAH